MPVSSTAAPACTHIPVYHNTKNVCQKSSSGHVVILNIDLQLALVKALLKEYLLFDISDVI